MSCPKCHNVALQEIEIKRSGIKVDRCPQCKGVWFDAGELESLLSVAAKGLKVPPGAQRSTILFCPRCPASLFRFKYPQTYVKVEMCKECGGLWLDSDEFNEIKSVRQALEKTGKLEEHEEPGRVKGGLLNFIDAAIEALR